MHAFEGGRMGAGIRIEHILHPHHPVVVTAGRRAGATKVGAEGGGAAAGWLQCSDVQMSGSALDMIRVGQNRM
jgi:hypothetical protein